MIGGTRITIAKAKAERHLILGTEYFSAIEVAIRAEPTQETASKGHEQSLEQI